MAAGCFLSTQQIDRVSCELGSELCRALELLGDAFHYEFELPANRRNISPRDFAEWREAKTLVSHLKYSDPEEVVRTEEMGWALARVSSYSGLTAAMWGPVISKAAQILGIDLAQPQPIPADLDRKISNELLMLRPNAVAVPAAVAA